MEKLTKQFKKLDTNKSTNKQVKINRIIFFDKGK
jgi:hypothetical protein